MLLWWWPHSKERIMRVWPTGVHYVKHRCQESVRKLCQQLCWPKQQCPQLHQLGSTSAAMPTATKTSSSATSTTTKATSAWTYISSYVYNYKSYISLDIHLQLRLQLQKLHQPGHTSPARKASSTGWGSENVQLRVQMKNVDNFWYIYPSLAKFWHF